MTTTWKKKSVRNGIIVIISGLLSGLVLGDTCYTPITRHQFADAATSINGPINDSCFGNNTVCTGDCQWRFSEGSERCQDFVDPAQTPGEPNTCHQDGGGHQQFWEIDNGACSTNCECFLAVGVVSRGKGPATILWAIMSGCCVGKSGN